MTLSGKIDIPTLAVTLKFESKILNLSLNNVIISVASFSTTSSLEKSSRTTTNSSPPSLAKIPKLPTNSSNLVATTFNSTSPISCPKVSFIFLK